MRDSLKSAYAPDKRVAIYAIDVAFDGGTFILSGETDSPQGLNDLKEGILSQDFKVLDKVNVLPDSSVGDRYFALVNNSVANIRSMPKHSSELSTQAILGTKLKVLQLTDEWYRIQTPDGYLGWVDHGGVTLLTRDEMEKWEGGQKLIFTEIQGNVYQAREKKSVVSDIVLGGQLLVQEEIDNGFIVSYPDGRQGYLQKTNVQLLVDWKKELEPSGDLIEFYARAMLGSPYLWGGTSSKGVDCSGFTKMAYMMNGMILSRDASQQVHDGVIVDEGENFENLEKGDLLFFGREATDSTKRKVTHVGIWLGDQEFIHASQRVRISSFDSVSAYYDDFNLNRYLCARRYLLN